MPIATDSGYLPDWLAALLRQGQIGPNNAPAGLFSDTAASPSPNVGLLSNLPQFTGVQPNAPAFQGGNAPNGPLPDQSPTFSYMSPTPPWGGSGPSNSYPSMTMPQDPGPMNIGPAGAGPSFTGVSPNAPFTANGPTSVQDQVANVPLPPRRPTDLRDFQANTAGAPADLNAPPPGQPNANVIGTEASGAPEVTAQKSLGLGDYLGKAANAIGSIYGAGGPGDALIALGLSNRTNGASIQALNSMNANRIATQNAALKQLALARQVQAGNATVDWLVNNKGIPRDQATQIVQAQIGGITKPLEDAVRTQTDTTDIKNYEYWLKNKPDDVPDPGFAVWTAAQKEAERGPRIAHPGDVLYSSKGVELARNEGGGATMDADTIESLAQRVAAGDNTALVGLGRGRQTAENIAAVQKRVAEIAKDLPDHEKTIIQNRMELAGKTAGARTAGVLNAKLDAFASEADSAIDLARETSRNLPRTQWLTVNKLIQAGQTEHNDPQLSAHLAQTNAVVNTYAKAINPQSSGGALADREHARDLLAAAKSPEAFEATLNQMQREVRVAHRAIRNLGTLRDQPVETSGPIPAAPKGTPGASSIGILQAGQDWLRGKTGSTPQAAPAPAAPPVRVVTPPTPEMRQQLLQDARDAISKNANPDKVRSKLLSLGVDPKDL
jgi:hypothetical protein